MSKKAWFYVLFFCVLFLGFYVALTRIIPGYGRVDLPVLSTVKPFSFESQEGRIITNRDVAGKVYVAEYFFTTCKGICPKMNNNLKKVYETYRNDSNFLILSHTVDPETDSAARLKVYGDSMGIDAHQWLLLTGSKSRLYRAARESYLLDDPNNNKVDIGQQFIHTQFFALVDRNGQVRKIFDGLKQDEISSLKSVIAQLLEEKPGKQRFSNALFTNNPTE
jgi:protein SCO1